MQKRAAIPALILAQLRWVDEEAVAGGKQRVRAEAPARQLERVFILEQQREIGIFRAQILAELVAKILRRVALREHGRRGVAVDRAVIARHEHLDLAARGFLQHAEQRRPLEPLQRELAQRDLVARHLVENRRLGAAVREQVHEVEDERADPFRRDRVREATLELVRLVRRRDLVVLHWHLASHLDEMRLEQILLVRVERLVLPLAPPIRKACRDLVGKETAEQRIASIRRRRRQHAEVVRRLDVEQRREHGLEKLPLIEAQAVDDDERRRLVL